MGVDLVTKLFSMLMLQLRDVYTRMKLVQMVTITNGLDRWSKVVLLCVR
jgi:hypothetical protein